jgi:hypothetical protein
VESTYGVQVRFRLLGDLSVQTSPCLMSTLVYGAAEARVESNVVVVMMMMKMMMATMAVVMIAVMVEVA